MINIKRKINIIIAFLIICLLVTMPITWADIENEEEIITQEEIQQEVVASASMSTEEPKLNSRIALIYDRNSGRILYEKNGNKQTPMASTTKIMTSIVVMENANLDEVVTIDAKAAGTGGSRLGLKKNDKITVHDLLYGLMLRSGNDAAVALAIHVGGSIEGFAEMMNKKAVEMGLCNSHFVVPHGLDMNGHYTTAYELAKMADYALKNEKIKQIVGTRATSISINGKPRTITNTNKLLGSVNGVYGVKTGFTNGAGRCLVTACKRGDLDIITVVLGADTTKIRTADSIKLIEYAYKNYKVVDIKQKIDQGFQQWKEINRDRIIINKGEKNKMQLNLQTLTYEKAAIKNTEIDNVTTEINNLFYLEAPIKEGEIIGNMKIKIGDEVLAVLAIQNKEEIRKKTISNYLVEFLKILSYQIT